MYVRCQEKNKIFYKKVKFLTILIIGKNCKELPIIRNQGICGLVGLFLAI